MWVTGGVGQTPSPVTGTPVLTQLSWPAGAKTWVAADGQSGLSDGISTYGIRQVLCQVMVDCDDFSLLFAFAGGEEHGPLGLSPSTFAVPGNGGTVSACVFKQSTNPNSGGTPIDVTWGGGLTTYTWSPEQIVKPDPIAGPWHAGDFVVIRALTQVASGGAMPLGTKTSAATSGVVDGWKFGTGTPTDLHTGTVPSNNNAGTYAAFGPCGSASDTVHTPAPIVALVGTSIDEGYNENSVGHAPDIVQALANARIPHVRVARGGESALKYKTTGWHEIRQALLAQATDIVTGHLVNDFNAYSSWPACATTQRSLHQLLAGLGKRVWQITAPPSYSQSYTVPSDHSALIRIPVNDWYRAGCPESAGGVPVASGTAGAVPSPYLYHPTDGLGEAIFERADVNETARNSGLWKNGYTGDFTHPNTTGHAAGATAFADGVQRFWTAFGGTPPTLPPPPPPTTALLNLQMLGGSLVRLA